MIGPNSQNEFARMLYVACSRAIDELYIHIKDIDSGSIKDVLDLYVNQNNLDAFYEFR